MKRPHCKDTKKYKKPNNQERFDRIVDTEMEKGYFVKYEMSEEKAYNKASCPAFAESSNAKKTTPAASPFAMII